MLFWKEAQETLQQAQSWRIGGSFPSREERLGLLGCFLPKSIFCRVIINFIMKRNIVIKKSFFLGGNRAINLSPNLFAEIGIFLISNQERSEF